MRRRFLSLLAARKFKVRLCHRRKKRFFRCPACHAVQSVPVIGGQTKVVCRKCGEIFLRRT